MISQSLLKELGTILKEDFGKEFTKLEILKIGNDLLSFFDMIAKCKYENDQTNGKTRT